MLLQRDAERGIDRSPEPGAIQVPNAWAGARWDWSGENRGDAIRSQHTRPPFPALPDLTGQSYLRKRCRSWCCRVFASHVKAAQGPPAAAPCFVFPHSKVEPLGCPKTPRGDAKGSSDFVHLRKQKHWPPNQCCSCCKLLVCLLSVQRTTSTACGMGPHQQGTGLQLISMSKWHLMQS